MWLTEFSTVDWNGTGTWTEEDNYNWLAEFMWRAESLPVAEALLALPLHRRHHYPRARQSLGHGGPALERLSGDGVTPTAFGELYFAWDGDATVRGDKPYFIHNKGERKRLRNAVWHRAAPASRWIRDGGDTVQWVLRPSGTAGPVAYHLAA